jgi:A/G-specific adenine glycosylase
VATAKEQDLLLLWQGLGYYARIRNFQKACQIIVEKFNGRIPQSSAELKKLPGIGTYTAAAIASICFHEPIAVIDGNVKRVLARLFCFKKEVSSQQANTFFAQTSAQLLDKKNPGDFNQAMMELGALICTRKPLCAQCLVKKFCASVGKNPEELPYKKKTNWINKRINLHIMHSNKNILLKKPTQDSLVKGMWELPLQLQHSNTPTLKHFVRHTITNKRITAHVTLQQLTDAQLTKQACGDLECVPWEHLDNLPIGTLSRKALASYLRRTP